LFFDQFGREAIKATENLQNSLNFVVERMATKEMKLNISRVGK